MLILVAVTINLAADGGLFENARTAKSGTQKELDRENLLAAVTSGYQEGGDFDIAKVTLPTDKKWCNKDDTSFDSTVSKKPSNEGNWVITKSNNKFYVDKDGNILDNEPPSKTDTTLEKLRTEFLNKDFNSVYIDNEPGQLSSGGMTLNFVSEVEGEGENVGVFSYQNKNYIFGYNEATGLIDRIENC